MMRTLYRVGVAAGGAGAAYLAYTASAPEEHDAIPHKISKNGVEHHRVVVVGGGAGGLTAASMMARKLGGSAADVAVVEPSEWHYYQPMWTMAAGGLAPVEKSRRPMSSVMPRSAVWIKQAAARFEPDKNTVLLADGTRVRYDYLVVATGLVPDWSAVKGLKDALGRGSVISSHGFKLAAEAWSAVEAHEGGVALFTQPHEGVTYGSTAQTQSLMYLAEHCWRSGTAGRERPPQYQVEYLSGETAVLSTAPPRFGARLKALCAERAVGVHLGHELVEVDGYRRVAVFRLPTGERVSKRYDLLHVTPQMRVPPCLGKSKLVTAAHAHALVEVDSGTLQHKRYPNVFSLGDCANLPTPKTAAAITAQAPVLAHNLKCVIEGREPSARYDGYTACPVFVSPSKMVLAEYTYGGTARETFPAFVNQARESAVFCLMQTVLFPLAYWNLMLQGRWFGPRTCFEPDFADSQGSMWMHVSS